MNSASHHLEKAKLGLMTLCHGLSCAALTAWVRERIPALFIYLIPEKMWKLGPFLRVFAYSPLTSLLFFDLAWLISRSGLFLSPGTWGDCLHSREEEALPCLHFRA